MSATLPQGGPRASLPHNNGGNTDMGFLVFVPFPEAASTTPTRNTDMCFSRCLPIWGEHKGLVVPSLPVSRVYCPMCKD